MHLVLPLLSSQSTDGRSLAEGPDMTRYLLVCVGLLGAVVALAWAFRKVLADRLRERAARRSLALIDVLPLGGKRQLAVARCYDRTFLLGLGEKEVRLVAELDAVVSPRSARSGPPGRRQEEPVDFRSLLASAQSQNVPRPATAGRPPRAPRMKDVVG